MWNLAANPGCKWFFMPIEYLIPAFIAMLLVMALPFFSGGEYRFLLKLILGLVIGVVPLAIAATRAGTVPEFLAIWFLVLLAPFLWLFGGEAGREARIDPGEGGLLAQLLPWLPLIALLVIVMMVVALKLLHLRATRREPH